MPHKIEIYGTIGWSVSARRIVRQLSDIEADEETDNDVTVHINSGGGFTDDAVAIYNRLIRHPGKVTAHIDGLAASAATIILMAGEHIAMPDNATLMVHQPWSIALGTADDLRDVAGVLDMTEDSMVRMYARRTGLSESKVRDLLQDETWMNAETAEELGFVDEVINPTDTAEEASAQAAESYRAVAQESDRLNDYRKPPKWAGVRPEVRTAARILASATREEIDIMSKKNNVEENEQQAPQANEPNEPQKAAVQAAQGGGTLDVGPSAEEIRAEERKRVTAIASLCASHNIEGDFSEQLIDNGLSVTEAKAQILDHLGNKPQEPELNITFNKSENENRDEGIMRALEARTNLLSREEARAEARQNPFMGATLSELCLMYDDSKHGTRMERIGRVFAHAQRGYRVAADVGITHTTGDFTSILENIAHKSMLMGWDQSPQTFEPWTNRGVLTDFKQASRAGLNLFPELDEVPDGAEYTAATMGDRNVDIQLATYGKTFGITRQAIINDDMSAFTTAPQRMGAAAARTVGTLVYAVLTDNGNFADGTALFHADHNNTDAVDIDRTGVQALRAAMATQTDPGGETLNIQPSYLLVPAALSLKATEITQAQLIQVSNAGVTNVQAGDLEVIVEPRLDADDVTQFYLVADGSQYDTVEVAYLNGNDMPFMEQQDGWRVDGTSYKVRIDAGVVARDFRAMQRGTSGTTA